MPLLFPLNYHSVKLINLVLSLCLSYQVTAKTLLPSMSINYIRFACNIQIVGFPNSIISCSVCKDIFSGIIILTQEFPLPFQFKYKKFLEVFAGGQGVRNCYFGRGGILLEGVNFVGGGGGLLLSIFCLSQEIIFLYHVTKQWESTSMISRFY